MSETFLVPVRTSKAGALALRTGRLLSLAPFTRPAAPPSPGLRTP
jgi:hypothetical protein